MTPRHRATLLLLILIVGLMTRVWDLSAQPLWCDEGNNAYFASLTTPRLVEMSRLTHDTDPPAHRLALKLWLAALGPGDVNLRLLSAALSAATIAVLYFWGKRRYGPSEGLVAAGLLALSPMAVYYGREAKGYALVALLAALGLWLWDGYLADRATGGRRRGLLWVAYILCQALMLGTHYYAALLIVAQGAWLAAEWAIDRGEPERARRFARWAGAQMAAAVIVAPWLVLTLGESLHGAEHVPLARDAYNLVEHARVVATEVAAGPVAPAAAAWVAVVALGAAAGWALARDGWRRAGLLAAVVVVPVALAYAAQLVYPFFFPRFLLFVLAPLGLLAARGLILLRWRGAVLGALLVGAWLTVYPATLRHDVFPEQDLRPAAQVLRELALPGDALITGYVWQEGILRMYAPAAPTRYILGWYDPDEVGEALGALFAERSRLWYLSYAAPLQDPGNPAGSWLEHNALRVTAVESGAHTLALYLAPCEGVGDGARTVTFEAGMRLHYDPLDARVSPGQPVRLDLMWRVTEPPSQPYSAFVHLVDGEGHTVAQADGAPRHGLEPLPHFAPGEAVTDCRALLVPRGAHMGQYTLRAGLYDPDTGERVPVLTGGDQADDYVVLGEVTVAADLREH